MLCMRRNNLLLILWGQICASSPRVNICRDIFTFSTSPGAGLRILHARSSSMTCSEMKNETVSNDGNEQRNKNRFTHLEDTCGPPVENILIHPDIVPRGLEVANNCGNIYGSRYELRRYGKFFDQEYEVLFQQGLLILA